MSLWLRSRISKWNSSSNSARRFSPLDIPNLVAWYRADLGITLNGADVSDWADQSGNGNDLTQATAVDQPLWNVSDSNLNNNPSIEGDGVSEYLQRVSFVGGALTQPSTIFKVFEYQDNVGTQVGLDSGQVSFRHMIRDDATSFQMFAGTLRVIGTMDTNPHIIAGLFNVASSNSWLDGIEGTPAGSIGTDTMNGITLFAQHSIAQFAAVKIAEVAVYNAALTASDINPFGNYAADRYGITWTDI